jgi:zinc and cadmium transporter
MSVVSLVGGLFLFLAEKKLKTILLPMVAFAAGALLGGAFFHMLPAYFQVHTNYALGFLYLLIGYCAFFILEQFLHWHHCNTANSICRKPLTYLILIGDGLHNFIGGMAVASTFLIDLRLGIITWLAAVAHEIPQEMGDFAVLIHGGWSKKKALIFNFISASTFLLGAMVTYFISLEIDLSFLIPFAAGNFIYIASSDLIPEVNKHTGIKESLIHFVFFILGLGILGLLTFMK